MTKDQVDLVRRYLAAFAEEATETSEDHERLQLAALKQRHDRLVDAYVDGNIEQATFAARKERLLIEEAKLEEQLVAGVDQGVIVARAALAARGASAEAAPSDGGWPLA